MGRAFEALQQEQCTQLDAAQQTLSSELFHCVPFHELRQGAEVERLRRTNDALCQQVLGSEGEVRSHLSDLSVISAGALCRRLGAGAETLLLTFGL